MRHVGTAENKGERIASAQVILLVSKRLSFYFLKARGREMDRLTSSAGAEMGQTDRPAGS